MTRTESLQSPGGLEVGGKEGRGAICADKETPGERGINSGSRIWRLRKPGYIQASPGSPGVTTKPPNRDKTYTHLCVVTHIRQLLRQEALASLLPPLPQGWADPIGHRRGVQGPQDHRLPGTQLHTVNTSSFPDGNMLCASLCRAARVRGRVRLRSETVFVGGLEGRLEMRAPGGWPETANIEDQAGSESGRSTTNMPQLF